MIEIITYIASQLVDIETNGNPHIANAIYAVYANVLHAVGQCNVIYHCRVLSGWHSTRPPPPLEGPHLGPQECSIMKTCIYFVWVSLSEVIIRIHVFSVVLLYMIYAMCDFIGNMWEVGDEVSTIMGGGRFGAITYGRWEIGTPVPPRLIVMRCTNNSIVWGHTWVLCGIRENKYRKHNF